MEMYKNGIDSDNTIKRYHWCSDSKNNFNIKCQ